MKMHIREFAKLTSVSVRTLHYYHRIGLLEPAFVDEQNGYRYYDESSLQRMQEILFYRELDFSLKSISEILSSPNYEKGKALADQRRLLLLKKERLERLLDALDLAEKGKITMDVFDKTDYEEACRQHEEEVRERWGETHAYREYAEKSAGYTQEKWQKANEGLNSVFEGFAQCMKLGHDAASKEAQTLVEELKQHITENYYTCTTEILAGLGKMYVADDRFRKNIDRNGQGTAEFAAEAIALYCKG